MTEMVTVGGIRYRKADAAEQGLQADSKAHQKRVAEGTAPVGVTEKVFKAANPNADKPESTRKASGARDKTNGTQPLNSGQAAGAAGDNPGGADAGNTTGNDGK